MKKLFYFFLVLQCSVSGPAFSQGGGGVKNGDTAPDFTGKDQKGHDVSLSANKVVLMFYPKDDVPTLPYNSDSLKKAGYSFLGVSSDHSVGNSFSFKCIAVDPKVLKGYVGNGWSTERTTIIVNENSVVANRINY